jgi:CDP-diacylglycerol--glycerol-3-phosphate 3-phosphatidyltransferase
LQCWQYLSETDFKLTENRRKTVRVSRIGSIFPMRSVREFRDVYEVEGRRLARWFVRVIGLRHLSPNVVTVSGCIGCAIAAVLVWHEQWLAAALVFFLGSLLDALDGAVAKLSGKVSAFGAFLDSTLDRVGEGFVLGALGLVFARYEDPVALACCFVALAGSYLVSYTRAKAEALGVECKGGLASRFERVVVLTAGLTLSFFDMLAAEVAVYVLAVATTLTVLQRIWHVNRSLSQRPPRRRKRRRRRRSSAQDGPPG